MYIAYEQVVTTSTSLSAMAPVVTRLRRKDSERPKAPKGSKAESLGRSRLPPHKIWQRKASKAFVKSCLRRSARGVRYVPAEPRARGGNEGRRQVDWRVLGYVSVKSGNVEMVRRAEPCIGKRNRSMQTPKATVVLDPPSGVSQTAHSFMWRRTAVGGRLYRPEV